MNQNCNRMLSTFDHLGIAENDKEETDFWLGICFYCLVVNLLIMQICCILAISFRVALFVWSVLILHNVACGKLDPMFFFKKNSLNT